MAIIALTLLVRIVLLPLTLKQFKSMQSMARLQPEIKKLQEKYKNDKERLNQEMMRFYRENKVNPFASCLPMVAQLPVFLSLFYMLREDLRQDICPEINPPGTREPGALRRRRRRAVPLHPGSDEPRLRLRPGHPDRALRGLAAAVDAADGDDDGPTQRMIFLALPFFFVLFVWQFPAGLLVYWITTNLWTIAQQAIVRKRLGPLRPPGQEPESLSDMIGRISGRKDEDDEDKAAAAAAQREGAERPARQVAVSGKRAQGAAERATTGSAAEEEETLREASMSESGQGPESASDRVREVLEDGQRGARPRRRGPGRGERGGIRGVLDGRGPRALHRPPRPDDRRRPAPRLQDRQPRRPARRHARRRRRRRATARGASKLLQRQADQAALDAVSGGRPVALDAMSATERKVVHEYLKDRDDVETYSEGTEPDRHLVVAPLSS